MKTSHNDPHELAIRLARQLKAEHSGAAELLAQILALVEIDRRRIGLPGRQRMEPRLLHRYLEASIEHAIGNEAGDRMLHAQRTMGGVLEVLNAARITDLEPGEHRPRHYADQALLDQVEHATGEAERRQREIQELHSLGLPEGLLDEMVLDAKAGEASGLNNSGVEAQLNYLLREGHATADFLREVIEEEASERRGADLAGNVLWSADLHTM